MKPFDQLQGFQIEVTQTLRTRRLPELRFARMQARNLYTTSMTASLFVAAALFPP